MRSLTALLLSGLLLAGCSSDEAAADAGPNKCHAAGGECAVNFPFVCRPGKEATTGELAGACGIESSSGKQMPCCFPVVETDTGVDTGPAKDSATDAPADAEASVDATGDAPKDAPVDASGDAVTGDATDGG